MKFKLSLILLFFLCCNACRIQAGGAFIREEIREMGTYPFSNPEKVPILISRPYIYPYFRFDGYTREKVMKKWKVVVLENDYIRVEILPEAGGKILGAIEKSTGYDFIYKNDVIKFRNIAMRGPWTSGGIEFNFGIQGHTPATATPVDYTLTEHPDGSVSCTVGTMDLPSRTEWRMQILLRPDRAYFELQALWYNPTALHSSYYYWGNAAVKARSDARFYYPGAYHIGHSGDVHPWPVDEQGTDRSWYRNHTFGGNHTYHILGDNENYKGIYYHDLDVGAVSWSLKQDLPGKKLWFWSRAASGSIWEELLSDHAGQYIEIQSGRLFNQANEKSGKYTPFRQNAFLPYQSDTWSELWAPVVKTGGIKAMSPEGVLNVSREGGRTRIAIQSLMNMDTRIQVKVGTKSVLSDPLKLKPVEVKKYDLELPAEIDFEVSLVGTRLRYSSAVEQDLNERPTTKPASANADTLEQRLIGAEESFRHREYPEALRGYLLYLEARPLTPLALNRVAALYDRMNEPDIALEYLNRALALDTYDPEANFLYAQVQRTRKRYKDCFLSLGIAARASGYAVAANTLMAEIYLEMGENVLAGQFAERALQYQSSSIPALKVLAIVKRKAGDRAAALALLEHVLRVDPLSHFARFEKIVLDDTAFNRETFGAGIHAEFKQEVYLELAAYYSAVGLKNDAIKVLYEIQNNPEACLRLAVLEPEKTNEWITKVGRLSPERVFPYRRETEEVLEKALAVSNDWKIKYYAGLLRWGLGKEHEALAQFNACGNTPDYAPFYVTRGILRAGTSSSDPEVVADYKNALALDSNEPMAYEKLIEHFLGRGQLVEAAVYAKQAALKFPDRFNSIMYYAVVLLNEGKYDECLRLLKQTTVLPKEGGTLSHDLYTTACMFQALDLIHLGRHNDALRPLEEVRKWPLNLGVGEPFDADYRIYDYLTAYCLEKMGKKRMPEKALAYYRKVSSHETSKNEKADVSSNYFVARALQKLGDRDQAETMLSGMTESLGENRFGKWLLAFQKGDLVQSRKWEDEARNQYDLRAANLQFLILTRVAALK